MSAPTSCPCYSGRSYVECCRPFHQGLPAQTPEELMRSRFAAYSLGLADYVIDTTSRDNAQHQDRVEWHRQVSDFSRQTSFEGLSIIETGMIPEATVTFRAFLKQSGRDASFTEKSRFRREGDRWVYVDGNLSA